MTDMELKEKLENLEDCKKKDYQLMTSGHTSSYRFDGSDTNKPTLPNVTLLEAYTRGTEWEITADTIGGSAIIYEVSSGNKINLDQAEEILKGDIESFGLYKVVSILTEKYKDISDKLKKIDDILKKAIL